MTPQAPRQARLDLDLPLRPGLPGPVMAALADLLAGRVPQPLHPALAHPDARLLFRGESLDHATRGSCLLRDEDGGLRLQVSASLPLGPRAMEAVLDWAGGLIMAEPGTVPGFLVPADTHRHDMRLLVWSEDGQLRALGPLRDHRHEILLDGPRPCSMAGFEAAAGLPAVEDPATREDSLAIALRRVALAQAEGRALPVSQRLLDGTFLEGQGLFRAWMRLAVQRLHGFTTEVPALFLAA